MLNLYDMCTEIEKWLIDVRRDIHMTPELGLEEFVTKRKIIKYLDEIGIDYNMYTEHTGITAFINLNKEKTVAIRADIDALPISEDLNLPYSSVNYGKMHACGHDAHTSILLGTCKILYNLREELDVNVKFFFQPAEETIGGAKLMIKDGCMDNPHVDCIFGLHVDPRLEIGTLELKYNTLNASTDTVDITVTGDGCHAAYPHLGTDAIVIAANVITSLQTISSRNVDPLDSIALSLGIINGGIKENIVCDKVNIRGTLRTLNEEVRALSKKRIVEIAKYSSKSLGGNAYINIEKGYPVLKNSNNVINYVKKNATELIGHDRIMMRESGCLGAEDFSYYLERCEGAFYHIGCKNKLKNIDSPLHSSTFNIDEDCLKYGVMIHVINVLNFTKE
ncbi:M20 family metallopeptidase [Clostridioides mangenotii]|uniref:M20 metallopeptidase family protein n=1 Tax=Metaclostridioides mangenotii TaxID=1540 RepID=UPI00214A5936|nr:M20 family metallopeptidase [Clostridioides mangenotii]MCR1953480.1 M20 family metallopeptidase [Clostridioides mangenotii]